MRDLDLNRTELTQLVYRRLVDPKFRSRLGTTVGPDGQIPITIAMREDSAGGLIQQIHAKGGASNVVVPALNGFVMLAVAVEPTAGRRPVADEVPKVDGDCTVGVFLERLQMDFVSGAVGTYSFVVQGPGEESESGSAELIALGD